MLIDKNQVFAYDQSVQKHQACELFDQFVQKPNKTLSRKDYCNMRDHLIVEIGLSNAQKSGVVVNMTVGEFRANSVVESRYHIPVWDHKTNIRSSTCITSSNVV